MELKTKIHAEAGKHDLTITREFELPVELLFRAHVEADIFEQWMSHEYGTTKVSKLQAERHGGWEFQTSDAKGVAVIRASGTFHEFVPNSKITRTFEIEDSPFGVQLEFLEFQKLSEETSNLRLHVVYRSAALRDQMLKLPFAKGLDMAHNRLQEIVGKFDGKG